MVDVMILVEGRTESLFVSQVLAPHLRQQGLASVKPVTVSTSVQARTHRGGGNSWAHWRAEIQRETGSRRGTLRLSTLVDLYALPRDWPGNAETAAHPGPFERVTAIEQAMTGALNDRRVIPFVMLYEFETLLFAELDVLRGWALEPSNAVDQIKNDLRDKNYPCVEWIDDGPDTAPSKRIQRHWPGFASQKPAVGPAAAERIGLPRLRERCPHFNAWVSALESLRDGSLPSGWPVDPKTLHQRMHGSA